MTETGSTTAIAHPNIALVKYWGKQAAPGNLPATPNLSITLAELTTTTTVCNADEDRIVLNDSVAADAKISTFLSELRGEYDIAPLHIETQNNFPTGAGLASSASGFAALITALNAHAKLGMDSGTRSQWARRGSASAARSIFAGYVALTPPSWQAEPLASADHWPLHTIVAVTSEATKSVSSTVGMETSRKTSPYYDAWLSSSAADYSAAHSAILARDFEQLADTAELSCLKMHSVMMTSNPTLAYWNPATVACMDAVRTLRSHGTPVFFTIDAGPQVKAICLPEAAAEVEAALTDIAGVTRTFSCGMGEGARLAPPL